MKTTKKYPNKEYFHSFFRYENGRLFWKQNRGKRRTIGKEAGRPDNRGYFRVCVAGKEYKRSRIVYIIHYGNIPDGMLVDHKNGIKGDDRICNLRLATNSQNKMNCGERADNKSGQRGVRWKTANKKWEVSIFAMGKNRYVGLFSNKIEAIGAYRREAAKYYGEFAKNQQ